jgi:transcriptional regulator with XRE-family HTH domain
MFDMRRIERRIADIRRAKKMVQMELSDRADISRRAISKWERCKSMPDTSALPLPAKIYCFTLTCALYLR